jgi:hypothetical protein
LFTQLIACALSLALASAGSSMAARMAMIAMTTNNSISVKARSQFDGARRGFILFGSPERRPIAMAMPAAGR